MKNIIINTNIHTYLIKFKFQTPDNYFIIQESGIMDVLKKYDKNGIEYIKQFEPSKAKFIQISKKELLNRFSWNTETHLYLQKHYYFN